MQCPDQKPSRLRQPNLLPFTASEKCYPGYLGYYTFGARDAVDCGYCGRRFQKPNSGDSDGR